MATPPVHTWLWTNYPSGDLKITLIDQDAFLLVSALVLLVTFGGDALFDLFRRTCRRWGWLSSVPTFPRFLENKISALELFPKLLYSIWSHRSVRNHKRVWPFTIFVVLWAFAIPVLSIFVSWAITDRTEENPQVIAASRPNVGKLWLVAGTDRDAVFRDTQWNLNRTLVASNYFETCYQKEFFAHCNSNLNVESIPRSVIHNVSCPFDESLCRKNETAGDLYLPFRIETDFIDQEQLGLNTKAKFSVKKAVDCAPVKTQPFCQNCDDDSSTNRSFVFGDPNLYYFQYDKGNQQQGYRLMSYAQTPLLDSRLFRTDGATTMIWLSAPRINYFERQDDPLFQANIVVDYSFGRFYESDYWATAMGCVDQWLVCNNRTNVCSGWQGIGVEKNATSVFNPDNMEEFKIGLILYWAFNRLDIHHTLESRFATGLNAQRGLSGYSQIQIARNQSQVEADIWFGVSLAKLQLAILSVGTGDPYFNSTGFRNWLDVPNVTLGEVAPLIKFRNGEYSVIETLGVGLLLTFSIILILASWLCKYLEWRMEQRRNSVVGVLLTAMTNLQQPTGSTGASTSNDSSQDGPGPSTSAQNGGNASTSNDSSQDGPGPSTSAQNGGNASMLPVAETEHLAVSGRTRNSQPESVTASASGASTSSTTRLLRDTSYPTQ